MMPHRCFHAIGVLAGLAVLSSTPACSEMLGFDDVGFAPDLAGAADASATDGATHDTGTADHEGGAVDGTPPEPDAEAGESSAAGCGDQVCSSGETCSGCPGDCGACPASCGDGACGDGETCSNCPGDCGACPASCGDGTCGDGEACSNCPGDCGACPAVCGDSVCNGAETCSDCPGDCGACPPVCGNGACEPGESCAGCPADCAVTACPSSAGVQTGGGLVPIDVCAFPMSDTGTWAARDGEIAGLAAVLPTRGIADILGDLNRQGTAVSSVPGLSSIHRGMRWEQGDMDVTYWIPQGVTGSGDSVAGPIAGQSVVLTSWYYDGAAPDKGVRIAIANAGTRAYRFALLVEPFMNGGRPDFKAVVSHAGGIAWFGNLLYVAQTSQGFRVFDMSRILQVATDADTIGYDAGAGVYRAHNYKYVIPQIGTYQHVSACSPVFSFTALDRATSPPSLVSGEYVAGSPTGRLFRWTLDPTTGRLAGGLFVPSEAFYGGQTNVQGAVPAYGRWLLSSSAPANGHGALYGVAVGSSSTHAWSDSPEDLYIDVSTGELWGLSEATGARYLYSRLVSSYQ